MSSHLVVGTTVPYHCPSIAFDGLSQTTCIEPGSEPSLEQLVPAELLVNTEGNNPTVSQGYTTSPHHIGSSPHYPIAGTPIVPHIGSPHQPKRSARDFRPPGWLNDFVHGPLPSYRTIASCLYPISNYISYTSLSASYLDSICNYSTIKEPETYAEAVHDTHWVTAMNQEI